MKKFFTTILSSIAPESYGRHGAIDGATITTARRAKITQFLSIDAKGRTYASETIPTVRPRPSYVVDFGAALVNNNSKGMA